MKRRGVTTHAPAHAKESLANAGNMGAHMEHQLRAIAIRMACGKGAKARLSAHILASLPAVEEAAELMEQLNRTAWATAGLFPDHQERREMMQTVQHRDSLGHALRPVRALAAQHLAMTGVPEDQIMAHDRPRREVDHLPARLRWPPSNAGNRRRDGQRRAAQPREEHIGTKAPTMKDIGVRDRDLYVETQQLHRVQAPAEQPQLHLWPLRLKAAMPADIQSAPGLPAVTATSQEFHRHALPSHDASRLDLLLTSRTIKSTRPSIADLRQAMATSKFKVCGQNSAREARLADGVDGVNVFILPEPKGRRGLIAEPLLNATIPKQAALRVSYSTRTRRRQSFQKTRCTL